MTIGLGALCRLMYRSWELDNDLILFPDEEHERVCLLGVGLIWSALRIQQLKIETCMARGRGAFRIHSHLHSVAWQWGTWNSPLALPIPPQNVIIFCKLIIWTNKKCRQDIYINFGTFNALLVSIFVILQRYLASTVLWLLTLLTCIAYFTCNFSCIGDTCLCTLTEILDTKILFWRCVFNVLLC